MQFDRFSLIAAAGLLTLFHAGCSPSIPEGRFSCTSATVAADCPPNWACRADGLCYRTPGNVPDGGTDQGGGGDADVTLRHELAHVALHRKVKVRVPLWFDEGYAVLASREYGGLAALQLNLAVAAGKVPTLVALDGLLRGSEGDATAAYALAASAVAELGRRHPTGTIDPLLSRLADGTSFEDAVLATTGLTAERFADTWHLATRRRYNWGIWLATGGVWVVLALLLAWAKAYRRHLDAPRREALNMDWSLPSDDEPITTDENPPIPLDPPGESR